MTSFQQSDITKHKLMKLMWILLLLVLSYLKFKVYFSL